VILYDSHIPLTDYAHLLHEEMMPFDGRNLSKKLLLDSGARALFIRSVTTIDQSLISGTSLRFIGTTTAGYEHVDIRALRNKGIILAHAPGSNAMPVVEYVLTALNEWNGERAKLSGLSIGIIGMGNIGMRVAMMCTSLGMNVYASDPPLESYGLNRIHGVQWVSLKKMFSICDCITVHAALTDGDLFPTKNMITPQLLSCMKNDSLLIHCARGGIVSEEGLLEAMNEHHVKLAIDVWNNEPSWNHALANHSCTLMATPHIAGYTHAARVRGIDMIVKEYCKQMEYDFESQCHDEGGLSFLHPDALHLIKERRFTKEKMLWLHGKDVDGAIFDEGRRKFMHDQETLHDIMRDES